MQIQCPTCSAEYEVEQAIQGQLVQCNCGHEFTAAPIPAASPKEAAPTRSAPKKKQATPNFGKPGGLMKTLLDAGWDNSDFNRYGDAGYKLLCWFVRLYQKVQRIALVALAAFSAYQLYLFADTLFSMKMSMSVIWNVMKTVGFWLTVTLASMWFAFFAQLIVIGVLFQVVKSVVSIEMNTRNDSG
jgi:predicted Zn finger-like uncharacterized protein